MTDDHMDLDELSLIWKSDTPPVTREFKNWIQTTRLKMIVLMAIETLVVALGSAIGVYLLTKGSLLLGGTILVFSLMALGIAFWSRSGAWSISTGSVKVELQTSIKQARAQYRWAWGGIWVCSAALIFLAIMAYSVSASPSHSSIDLARSFQYFSFALIFVAINLVMTSFMLENSRKKLFSLRMLYKQLNY